MKTFMFSSREPQLEVLSLSARTPSGYTGATAIDSLHNRPQTDKEPFLCDSSQ